MDAGVHLLILLLAGPSEAAFTLQSDGPANNDQSLCYEGGHDASIA